MKALLVNSPMVGPEIRALGVQTYEAAPGVGHLNEAVAAAGFEPDLVIVELFGPRPLPDGLSACPWPLVAVVYDSAFNHFWLRHWLKLFDLVCVDFFNSVGRLNEEGIHAHWLPYGVRESEFPELKRPHDFDLGFVGVIDQRPRRQAMLELLDRHWNISIAGDGTEPGQIEHRLSLPETAQHYARCQLVVNEYFFDGLNFRVFEAMASGRPLLTEATANGLPQLFQDGEHLITFTPETLLPTVRHALDHPEACERIALNGRQEILRAHTRAIRAEKLLELAAPLIGRKLTRDVPRRCAHAGAAAFHFAQRWPQAERNHLALAASWLDTALAAGAGTNETRWLRGLVSALCGEAAPALQQLSEAAGQLPSEPRVLCQLADILWGVGQDELARRTLRVALERGDEAHDEAARVERALARGTGPELWLAMGDWLHALGFGAIEPNASRFEAGFMPFNGSDWWVRAWREGDGFGVPLRLGFAYSESGSWPLASEWFAEALRRGADDPASLCGAARAFGKIFKPAESAALRARANMAVRNSGRSEFSARLPEV
ncbi:MAG: glycosyltransferase [bacterium]|nr:glycosyltransferase [bacterium]